MLGYEICNEENFEPEFQKIAIYFKDDIRSIHAARQLGNGSWTSKLGQNIDIEHGFIKEWNVLQDLSSREIINLTSYGQLRVLLKKANKFF